MMKLTTSLATCQPNVNLSKPLRSHAEMGNGLQPVWGWSYTTGSCDACGGRTNVGRCGYIIVRLGFLKQIQH